MGVVLCLGVVGTAVGEWLGLLVVCLGLSRIFLARKALLFNKCLNQNIEEIIVSALLLARQ